MAEIVRPRDAQGVADALAWAAAEGEPMEVVGAGTKRGLGHGIAAPRVLDLTGLSGITDYEPEELVLTAAAQTPIAEIEAMLRQKNQQLSFEPPDFGPLLGAPAEHATLGGVIAANLSGPRRIKAGAARDNFLGLQAVTGRGEAVKAGGRVVKNVTGYDVMKLLAGSYGTLAVLTEISVKVLPAAEKTRTVLVAGLDAPTAVDVLGATLSSPHDVSAAAFLPAAHAQRSSVSYVSGSGASVTAIRLEGPPASTATRMAAIKDMVADHGAIEELHGMNSGTLWREIRDAARLLGGDMVWRLSVPPAGGGSLFDTMTRDGRLSGFLDWGGGLIWLVGAADRDMALAIRSAANEAGGHATLMVAPDALKAEIPVFHPQPAERFRLTRRIKEGFDPRAVLNPGRMYPGV
ncbi:MAG: glycolate oxidase subunit GlcE [Pseudomonadota bacterium]